MKQSETSLPIDGHIKENKTDPARKDAFLPTDCPQNHAANLLELDNGDLLCVWFGGTQEGIPDISIYMSRLERGSDEWTQAEKLSDDPSRSEQNPVLFQEPDGRLWLMYTAQLSGNQDTAIVRYRTSDDRGRTWSKIDTLFTEAGTFIRQPLIVLDNGDWLLPVFYCITLPGVKWTGNRDISAVKISSDKGKTWEEVKVPGSTGCVHMNIEKLRDGTLLALFRSRFADSIYSSRSIDNGRTWSEPEPTELPNNNSSIQFTALQDGTLALVYNHMNANETTERRASLYDEIEEDDDTKTGVDTEARPAFWGAPRAPMTLALSQDGGITWPVKRNIEVGDGYAMTNNSKDKLNREFSYPSIKQGKDGDLHIAFTYYRQAIKYVRVPQTWAFAGQE
ncbi:MULTISPECIES: sialidase family protein [Bacillus]|uniref:Sialidase domain-containing protein n=1 Tax=Bacillus paralicheniformis TaxID=1648923 RepID=A0ABY3FTK5_9BACI|nr:MULTISPECIES: exo-alpha-sialidase [Bacillus]KUL18953.1 glycosyl hydrolase [Bacillus licheniformis LMG 6934]KFM84681.1 BNR repeat-like domain protein [Bacillus paralicheniformis]MBG9882986.1 glycosyl hydrolase [Bacillus paralicheniformis]MBL7476401.1 exo-alpha-sialidase [Bacillus paralicheniformis]MBU8701575.1 exo-alpha-sialidase [Bacillus paralicheniformis]